jgi:hypothetical protein
MTITLGLGHVNALMKAKEIFFCLFPDGFQKNPLHGKSEYPHEQPFFVVCKSPNCKGHQTSVASRTAYSNPVAHAKSCYGGEKALHGYVREMKKENGVASRNLKQLDMYSTYKAKHSAQDRALHHWIQLVCLHNISITKINDYNFSSLLTSDEVSYDVFIRTMLELSVLVEEKIAKEMEGKKGTIIHDGWSKFAKHYVCLLAAYMISTGKRNVEGEMLMEPVMTLLTCTTLPHDDAAGEAGDVNDGECVTTLLC